ncbi:hypothetical protein [Lentzea sp. NBRC 102530]|uniref:hypothetical protein n=1 Tax=Lentzea sp. NBRC 102530 TaxID=3032201 RepID=UPI0024A17901|nr:hypothetical protein [Lentzea sp. NBRC 102530]GLY50946.1 hypothetical protein Lesp01_46020 [Lentzea sp. NBRC 102530]
MNMPLRWDLVTPDQLGTMLDDVETPEVWYLDALAECAGKVLARSGNGDLVFVGRSLDSMYDLLGGAVQDADRVLRRFPVSFERGRGVAPDEVRRVREMAAEIGITPRSLARRERPVTFVDVVWAGGTFERLFTLLEDWIDEERETWPAIRRKLRFVGVTSRTGTSPNARRWHQDADWVRKLPASSVLNVSLEPLVWDYLGNSQTKLTWPYQLRRWREYLREAKRDERTRTALAEAVHLVALGRTREVQRKIARAMDGEPALSEPWLRALRSHLT